MRENERRGREKSEVFWNMRCRLFSLINANAGVSDAETDTFSGLSIFQQRCHPSCSSLTIFTFALVFHHLFHEESERNFVASQRFPDSISGLLGIDWLAGFTSYTLVGKTDNSIKNFTGSKRFQVAERASSKKKNPLNFWRFGEIC